MRLLIHAPNVHQGGGSRLLTALLTAGRARTDIVAVVDARWPVPPDLSPSMILAKVSPGIGSRLAAEWRLRSLVGSRDTILCFGNLPPLFGAHARVLLFLQNRYLVSRRSTHGLPRGMRVRNEIERLWLRMRLRRANEVIVQTPSMAREVRAELGITPAVVAFAPTEGHVGAAAALQQSERDIDFLYVSSGEPHKNHRNLLAAWRLLGEEGMFPSLCVTVSADRFPALGAELENARTREGLNVQNVGTVEPAEIEALYARTSAVIYPSRFESLGLPLLEADAHGLPIIAAELDYVREVLDPEQSFDPESSLSIARAVKRFCRRAESRPRILTPAEFLETLVGVREQRESR